jgi:dephospho-CoA kinase
MIIGLCGTSIAGRAEVAAYLITKGFAYHSIMLEVEEEAKKRGQNTPEGKRKIHEDCTKRYGKTVFLKRIMDTIAKDTIIDCITAREELALLKKRKDFSLIGVYSPNEVRFIRARAQELLEESDTEKRKKITDEIAELSELMKQMDASIVYPSPPAAIIAKVEEILKRK